MAGVTTFTQAKADAICERIADGESLRAICADKAMPSTSTVCKWLAEQPSFSEQYARARELQADALFDEILDISNTPLIGEKTKTTSDGKVETTTGDMIEHRRLQVDARKWIAGKLRPKKYGDKIDVNHSGSIQTMSEEQVNARLAELLGKAGAGGLAGTAGPAEGDEQA